MAAINISQMLAGDVANQANAKLLAWQESVINSVVALNPKMASAARFSGTVPLHLLPIKSQVSFMKAWRDIIGLDKVLNSLAPSSASRSAGIDSVFNSLKTVSPRDSKSPFLRFPVTGNSFLDDYYRSLNLNFSEKIRPVISGLAEKGSGNLASHFGPGIRSIPKLSSQGLNLTRQMPAGAKFTTFDIETASLMSSQHREISYKTGVVDSLGQIDMSSTVNKQILFRPRAFDRGTMGILDEFGAVQPHSLESFLQNKYGLDLSKLPTKKLGKDYAERMMPWLQSVNESDFVIGHNIARFDIPQIFTALAGTNAYQSVDQSVIPGFRALVDSTHSSIQGKMIDTLALARSAPNLTNLGVATELSEMGNLSTYSIENLLLETDLADRIGLGELEKKMGTKGLHFGEVDDFITLNIYKHLNDLQAKTLGGSARAQNIRNKILSSVAITPTTNIRKQIEIADPVLRHLIGTGSIDTRDSELNNLLETARAGDKTAAQTAFENIRSNKYNDIRFDINPIEHQVISTRNLQYGAPADASLNVDNLLFNNNIFTKAIYDEYDPKRDFSRGILDQRRFTDEEMRMLQGKLSDTNMPWAGLSFEERSLGTVLSHLTSGVNASTTADQIRGLTSDTLISRFEEFDPNKVAYETYSGRPSMPASLLERAGLLGGDEPSLLRLSSVNPTIESPQTRVNLVYDFLEGESQKLSKYLTELAENQDSRYVAEALGIETDLLSDGASQILDPVQRFRDAVQKGNLIKEITEGDRGVAIGQLQEGAAEGVARAVGNFVGLDELSDKSSIKFGLPFARRRDGVIETSGAVLTRHLRPEELPEIGRQVRHSTKVLDAFEQLTDAGNEFKLRVAQSNIVAGNDAVTNAIRRGYEAYQSIRPHQGKMLAAGLVISAGILLTKRHQEVEQYSPTMERMPYETGTNRYTSADLLQMNIDSGINKGYQRYDPLATAFVTSNLSDSAIGHSSMNWDKNNALYGGVL